LLVTIGAAEVGGCGGISAEPLPRDLSDELAAAHGLLSLAERTRLRRETLGEIVLPCLQALCAPRASGVFHAAPSDDDRDAPSTPAAVA
jgi:hypothetical protein